MPREIRACEAFLVKPTFHSRYSALFREYTYIIHNSDTESPFLFRYSWHIPDSLDIETMKKIKHSFEGERDFRFVANESDEKNCVRTVHFLRIKKFKSFIIVHIRANGFLRGMVRNIAGILVEVGRKRLKMDITGNIIEKQAEIKSLKAPPQGLFLSGVFYPKGVLHR